MFNNDARRQKMYDILEATWFLIYLANIQLMAGRDQTFIFLFTNF